MQPASPTIPKHDVTTAAIRSIHVQHTTDLIQKRYTVASLVSDPQFTALKHFDEDNAKASEQQTVARKPKNTKRDHEAAAEKITITVSVPVTSSRGTCAWNELFRQLKIYRSLNGHCIVPQHHIQNGLNLGKWVSNQRQQVIKRQRGEYSFLTEERIKALDDLGFRWQLDCSGHTWEKTVAHLADFKCVHGHTNVPFHYDKGNTYKIKLGIWVRRQREEMSKLLRNKKSTLTLKRIDDLNALGFVWKLSKSPKPKTQETLSGNFSAKSVAVDNHEESHELLPRHAAAPCGTIGIVSEKKTQKEGCSDASLNQHTFSKGKEYCSSMRAPCPEVVRNQRSCRSSSNFFSYDQQRLHSNDSLPVRDTRGNRFRHDGASLEEDSSRSLFCNHRYQQISSSALNSLLSDNAFSSPGVLSSDFLELGSMGSMTRSSDLLYNNFSQTRYPHEGTVAAFPAERRQLYLKHARDYNLERDFQLIVAQNRLRERHDTLLRSRSFSSSLGLNFGGTLHRSVDEIFPLRRAMFPDEELATVLHPSLNCSITGAFVSNLDLTKSML